MERETTIITTPVGKHKVKVHTYLTGREIEYVQEALFQSVKLKMGEGSTVDGLEGSQMLESTHRLMEKMIVSVDDGPGGVEPVLDMRSEDYQFVLEELNNITKKN